MELKDLNNGYYQISVQDDGEEEYEYINHYSNIFQKKKSQSVNNIMKPKKKYDQKYRVQWESLDRFRGWLTSVPNDPKMAFCLACKSSLSARKKDLTDHERSFKHKKHFNKFIGMESNGSLPATSAVFQDFFEGELSEEPTQIDADDMPITCTPDIIQNAETPTQYKYKNNHQLTSSHKRKEKKNENYSIELINTDSSLEKNTDDKDCCGCCVGDDFVEFGKYVSDELKTVTNFGAIQRAKLEINRVLFAATTGTLPDDPLDESLVQVTESIPVSVEDTTDLSENFIIGI